MTNQEALALKSYDKYCNCGGYARKGRHPHMDYCPQLKQYEEWMEALERMNMTPEQALKIIFPNLYKD